MQKEHSTGDSTPHTDLVITCVGSDLSYHTQWCGESRTFDLMLLDYANKSAEYRSQSEYYLAVTGFKLENIAHALHTHPELLEQYEYIWLPDHDLFCRSSDCTALFSLVREFKLDVAQPAVQGFAYHPITRFVPESRMRLVNFIEMMCPLFKSSILKKILPFFTYNRSGYGIDWLWSTRLGEQRLGIIDEVQVIHSKPVVNTGEYYQKLAAIGIDPMQEYHQILDEHCLVPEYREFARIKVDSASST